jgi:hypothetical protein
VTAPAVCEDCHRPLKDPASIARGRGPVCQAVLEGDTHISPAPRRPPQRPDPDQIPLPLESPVTEPMTEQQLRDYATEIILDHARDVERLSIYEMYEDWADEDGNEISDDDAQKISRLITEADITVSWPATVQEGQN